VGIIDRRRAAGTFRLLPAGSAGKLVLYSKGIASVLPALVTSGYQQIQNAGGAGIGTSILLASIFPEGKEGVNRVNNPEDTIRVGVKDLGTAIYRYHGGGAVSDFAWNIEGSIVGKIDGRVAVVHCHGNLWQALFVFKVAAVASAIMACHELP